MKSKTIPFSTSIQAAILLFALKALLFDESALAGKSSNNATAATSSDGLVVPPASLIIDSAKNKFSLTASGGALGNQINLNGKVDPITREVQLLLYFSGSVFQENRAGNWYRFGGAAGNWPKVPGDPRSQQSPPSPTPSPIPSSLPSSDGTLMPPSTTITDASGNAWTLVNSGSLGNQIQINGKTDPVTQQVVLMLYSNSMIFQKNAPGDWYQYGGAPGNWLKLAGDPRNPAPVPVPSATPVPSARVKYGVFARASGTSPYSVFIDGTVFDPKKTQNILDIGATWTRSPISAFFVDLTRINRGYDFTQPDALFAFEKLHGIEGIVGIENGVIQGPSGEIPKYPSAAEFGTYCSVIATRAAANWFASPTAHSYSIPGNEINSNYNNMWPTSQVVADYTRACYAAIKAADPTAFIWGFEINPDPGSGSASKFVADALALGCGPGTCYDGLSDHLSLQPTGSPPHVPAAGTPCLFTPGGTFSLQCLTDIQIASGSPHLPLMIGETIVTWPGTVQDAATQAAYLPEMMRALAAYPDVRYILHANLDECALYPSGYFMNGCLVDLNGNHVPAWQPVHDLFIGK